MTKSEQREVYKLLNWLSLNQPEVTEMVERGFNTLVRSARTDKSKTELLSLMISYNLLK